MEYISTRGNIAPVSAATAIKSGMVPGGGLFIPKNFPMFPATWQELQTMDYQALANLVFKLYLTDFAPQAVDQMAVSYTHLDVYKRQGLEPATC